MTALAAPRHAGGTDADLLLTETDDFVELFRMHYPRLVRALTLAGAPADRAEDLSQEAFARTFRHWRRVRRGANPGGYVYRVGFRLMHRRGMLPTSPLDDAAVASHEDATIASVDLQRALDAMPPRRRACAILCFALGFSPGDAADTLKLAPSTVRKQLDLARATLRATATL